MDIARKVLRDLPVGQMRHLNRGIVAATAFFGGAMGVAGLSQPKRSKLNEAANMCNSLTTEIDDWFVTRSEAGHELFDAISSFRKKLASAENLASQAGVEVLRESGANSSVDKLAAALPYRALSRADLIDRFDRRAEEARAFFEKERAKYALAHEIAPELAVASGFLSGATVWTAATWREVPFKAPGAMPRLPFALSALATVAFAVPVVVWASRSKDAAWHAPLYGEAEVSMQGVRFDAETLRKKAESGENVKTEHVLDLATRIQEAYDWTNGGWKHTHGQAHESSLQNA
jgi:hypothetical protein